MTSSRLTRVATLAAFALAFASAPRLAHAQRTAQDIESARQLYNQGIELRDKGDMKGALDKFRAAHALGNTPLTGIELCRTYAALKQPVEAREVCLGVARIPPLAQETARSQEARAEAGRIAEAEKPKIGALRLKVAGIPPGREALVLVDGTAVPPAALAEPRAINPGVHQITAKVGSGEETKATVETKEGETRDVELTVVAPAEPVSPPPGTAGAAQPAKDEKKMSPIALGSFVLAGVAGVIGLSAGVIALNAESDLEKKCVNKQCGRELHDDLDSAESAGTVSTAAFVIAGIALGGGLLAMLTAPKKSTAAVPARSAHHTGEPKSTFTPLLGPGGAGFRGTF
jgi:hypothetical protein